MNALREKSSPIEDKVNEAKNEKYRYFYHHIYQNN